MLMLSLSKIVIETLSSRTFFVISGFSHLENQRRITLRFMNVV